MSEINNINNELNNATIRLINDNNNIENIQNILFEIQTNMSILSDYYLKYGNINDLSNNTHNLLNN
tara:strand:+ start:1519 stop:1716 length:198 start_codon:yes stop_codon:yes gene_type:complete